LGLNLVLELTASTITKSQMTLAVQLVLRVYYYTIITSVKLYNLRPKNDNIW